MATQSKDDLLSRRMRAEFDRALRARRRYIERHRPKVQPVSPSQRRRESLRNSSIAAGLVQRLGMNLNHTEIHTELKGLHLDRSRVEAIILEYQRIVKKTMDYLRQFGRETQVIYSP